MFALDRGASQSLLASTALPHPGFLVYPAIIGTDHDASYCCCTVASGVSVFIEGLIEFARSMPLLNGSCVVISLISLAHVEEDGLLLLRRLLHARRESNGPPPSGASTDCGDAEVRNRRRRSARPIHGATRRRPWFPHRPRAGPRARAPSGSGRSFRQPHRTTIVSNSNAP